MYYVDGQLFHVGIRVHDLAAAKDEFSASFGVSWCAVRDWPMDIWLPDRGYTSMPIALTFSTTGPVRLELIQGSPGTPLDPDDGPGIHHLGYWVDDPAAETERLLGQGWELVMAAASPDDGYGRFTYVRSPSGLLIEPVGASNRERFEAWWAGGTLTPPANR
jgi:catechol 2,3-dioxygenase-like lactoylglutathione lyase family enzyme